MDPRRLRELANQNKANAEDEARQKRELESQWHQAELKKEEERRNWKQKLIDEKTTRIRKLVEEAANRGHYEVTIDSIDLLIFDWFKWYNPFHMLTGRISMFSKKIDKERQAMETFYLCRSLGLRPYLKIIKTYYHGTGRPNAIIEIRVKW